MWDEIAGHVEAGDQQFVVQLREANFRGRFDLAVEAAVADIEGSDLGLVVGNVDAASGPSIARIYITSVPRAQTRMTGPPDAPRITFSPNGPQAAGEAGRAAFERGDYAGAFEAYVSAMDKLHDVYVYENFQNRQASPADTWMVDGLVHSLLLLREADAAPLVRDGVIEATHRLRTITTAVETAGGDAALYRRGLDGLAEAAPDIDVSAVSWN